MNQLLFYGFILSSALCACGKQTKNTPEDVTEAFAQALADKDYNQMKQLCTYDTRGLVEIYKLTSSLTSPELNELEKNEATCNTRDEEATCVICCIKNGLKRQYDLVMENGSWKVKFNLNFKSGEDGKINIDGTIEPEIEPIEDAVVQ
jgi:hypothetical protein